MEVIFSARHANISSELKEYVQDKIDAALEGRPFKISSIRAVLDMQKNRGIAEIIVHMKGFDAEATADSYDMYEAVDKAVEKVERQLSRYLDKKQDHHKREKPLNQVEQIEEDEEDLEVDIEAVS